MKSSKATHIILVEDDQPLGEAIEMILKQYDYRVTWVKDGETALDKIKDHTFDMIILDLGLPRLPGLEVLKNIRANEINTPVIILTALGSLQDRIQGLDAGADDYLIKPFDIDELVARLRALQRRTIDREELIIHHKNITLDISAHLVSIDDQAIILSRREFKLLHKLLENIGRVLSRDQLAQSLYGWGDDVDSNALEVHIHNIRKKLGSDLIRTVRGVGYMIEKNE
jgi:two-component system, OmpR family, response regulator QseB